MTTTNPDGTHLVEKLRARVQAALDVPDALPYAAHDALRDLAGAICDEPDLTDPVIQAMARALLSPVDDLCETSRPMVQHILDGNLGQEAATAVAHLLMLLADTRGQVQGLERALSATTPLLLAPEGEAETEWAITAGPGADPDKHGVQFIPASLADAEAMCAGATNGGGNGWRRTVTRGPWQAVTTGDGES